jgi:UDP-glucose 4-epimerase
MKVLVTGGAGFIGSHLVAALVAAGDEVVVLDNLRRGDRARLLAARFVEGDVRDPAILQEVTQGCRRIYHLAAQRNVPGAVTDLDYSFTSNVVGTYNVLAAARAVGVERVVFSSSREVYGEVDRLPVAEDQPLDPKNAYGASKVADELYCRAFQRSYGLNVSVVRLANVYGPGDRDRVIPIWLDRARRGEELELYGGEQVIDFVPVSLVAEVLRRGGDLALGEQPINIGSGTGTRLRDLAARIQALPGVDVDLRLLPARDVEVTRFVADTTRMRTTLGLEPPADPLADLPALWEEIWQAGTSA